MGRGGGGDGGGMEGKEEQEKNTTILEKGKGRSGQSASQVRENLNLHCVHKKSCKHNDSEVKEYGLSQICRDITSMQTIQQSYALFIFCPPPLMCVAGPGVLWCL